MEVPALTTFRTTPGIVVVPIDKAIIVEEAEAVILVVVALLVFVMPPWVVSSPVTVTVEDAFTAPVALSVDARLTAPVTFTVEDIFTAPVALRVAVCRFPLEVAFVKVNFVEETLPPFILNTPEPVALVKNKLPIEIEEVAEVPVAFVIVTVFLKAAVELTFKVFAESNPAIVVEAKLTTPPDCEIVLLKVAPA